MTKTKEPSNAPKAESLEHINAEAPGLLVRMVTDGLPPKNKDIEEAKERERRKKEKAAALANLSTKKHKPL